MNKIFKFLSISVMGIISFVFFPSCEDGRYIPKEEDFTFNLTVLKTVYEQGETIETEALFRNESGRHFKIMYGASLVSIVLCDEDGNSWEEVPSIIHESFLGRGYEEMKKRDFSTSNYLSGNYTVEAYVHFTANETDITLKKSLSITIH